MALGRSEYYVLILFEFLFLLLAVQAVIIEDTTRFYGVLASMVIALFPVLAEWGLSVRFRPGVKTVIALALLLHVAGGINRWYWKFAPYYDKLAHVVAAMAVGMAILSLFLIFDTWKIRASPKRIIAGMIIIVVILGGLWEIGEYSIDLLVRSSYNNGVMDTIFDTIANLELGISEVLSVRPVQAAFASAGTFAVVALLPLLVAALAPARALIPLVSGASLVFLALLGGLAARTGGAPMLAGTARVTFWGALAMALTAAVGALFGAVV